MSRKELPEWRKSNIGSRDIPESMGWLIKEAKIHEMWIYHRTTKKWYTPEEFEKVAWQLYSSDSRRNNYSDFAIMDPMAGLNLRLQTLTKVLTEVNDFKKRIDEYYNTHLKKR